jgi:integrase
VCAPGIANANFRAPPQRKKAGLPRITFHDLRHTCASLLFQKNAHPKFVQELLGHASVAITLDT